MYLDLCGRRVPLQDLGSSSFAGLLSSYAPEMLPGGTLRNGPVPSGMAGTLPFRGVIADMLKRYMDLLYKV